jgi:hypothetical protein
MVFDDEMPLFEAPEIEEVEAESPTDGWGEREVVERRVRDRFSPPNRTSNLIARRERRLGGVALCIRGGVGAREPLLFVEAGNLRC